MQKVLPKLWGADTEIDMYKIRPDFVAAKKKGNQTKRFMLSMSGEDKEIKKRMHWIQSGKVKTLTREVTFKGAL